MTTEYKLKKMSKRFLSFILILSLITPFFYMPRQAKRAETFLGFGDIVVDVKHLVERIADNLAMTLAQQMIDRMVQSSVKWMQSGFEGNPAYVTDPRQFFTDIADQTAGSFIQKDLGYLCSPFQANIRLSLMQEYYEPQPFQCTLSEVTDNIEGFFDDFSQGGWDAWFSMTQNPTNNPYGAYLKARVEIDSRIANAIGLEREDLDRNQGFLSYKKCPAEYTVTDAQAAAWKDNPEIYNSKGLKYQAGDCLDDNLKTTVTPGTTLKAQLDKVLPSGLEKLISAQHMDQLVSGFAAGLLNKYVFGSKGLFASGKSSTKKSGTAEVVNSRLGKIDLDNDGIPDGFDADQDGSLASLTDVCYHGGQPPSCLTSSTTPDSPYYTPICQATNRAVLTLTEYAKFIDKNAGHIEGGESLSGRVIGGILLGGVGTLFTSFWGGGSKDNFKNKADADIWSNRTTEVDSAISEVISSIQSYNASYFDNMEISVNRFSNFIGKVQESLINNQDLDLARIGSGGGGLENLMKHTAYNLRYLQEVKTKFGNCTTPKVIAINAIPTPPEVESPDGGGGSGYCVDSGTGVANYSGDLQSAIGAVIAANSNGVADALNTTENAFIFLNAVATELEVNGFNATTNVKNGNDNPNSGDLIAVWREGDDTIERYDAVANVGAGDRPMRNAATSGQFTGDIPLDCRIVP